MRKRAAFGLIKKELGAVGHVWKHLKHLVHVSDAGRVETQRLVECLRLLRRVEARGESLEGRRHMWAEKQVSGGRACVERTRNMSFMRVTLDVSRLSGWLNASAFCAESKGGA